METKPPRNTDFLHHTGSTSPGGAVGPAGPASAQGAHGADPARADAPRTSLSSLPRRSRPSPPPLTARSASRVSPAGRRPLCECERHSTPFFRFLRAAACAATPEETVVTVISVPQAFNEEDLYVDLRSIVDAPLYLKCEGFNFAGSIKLKAATEMVEAAERDGVLKPDSVLIESSSGNLGVALAMIAASRGYRFLCVTDPRCNLSTRRLMEALGTRVHTVTEEDPGGGGLLAARKNYVRAMCASDSRYVWLNQYRNPNNWGAHYRRTAPAIARSFPELDVLFLGAEIGRAHV